MEIGLIFGIMVIISGMRNLNKNTLFSRLATLDRNCVFASLNKRDKI